MGRARGTARCAGADLGFALGAAGAGRADCSRANLGIAAAPGRSPTPVRTRTELGLPRACILGAAARARSTAGSRSRSSAGARAGVDSASGSPRAIMGSVRRLI